MSPGRARRAMPVCLSRTVSSARIRAISDATAAAADSASGAAEIPSAGPRGSAASGTGNRSESSYVKSSGRPFPPPMSANTSFTNDSSSGTARKLREIERRGVPPGLSDATNSPASRSTLTSASRNR